MGENHALFHLATHHLEEDELRLEVAGTQRLSAGSFRIYHSPQEYESSCLGTQVQNSQTFMKHILHISIVKDCTLSDLSFSTL